jgi:ketosteroid isomerase-like protein
VGENADIVRRLFDAFARRDARAVADLCAPDVEFVPVTLGLAGREEPYRGHEGMRRYLDDAGRLWQELRADPQAYHEAGDQVAVVGRVYAWGVGRVIDAPVGWLWRIRDGRIVYGRVFDTQREALEAAGIEDA